MKLSTRMIELQAAMSRYGETSIRNFRQIHKLGDEMLYSLNEYLGEGTEVLGVKPVGDWEINDYRDAKFSTYYAGFIRIEPIQMGIAIKIPHTKDDGAYWLRVTVGFEIVGGEIAVYMGDDERAVRIPIEYRSADIERIQAALYDFAMSIFDDPVKAATAAKAGKIGFVNVS